MKASSYRPEDIRNIVLLGQGGAGKTLLAEAILHRSGVISRMGSIEQSSTTSDYEPEARAHHHSTNSTLLFATRDGREINILDTPGHPEFVGYALAALPPVEIGVIVVNAMTGVEHNTRRLFHAAGAAGLARMIVVNKIDAVTPAQLKALVDELKSSFGKAVHCINLPCKGGADVIDCFDSEAGQADFLSVAEVHAEMMESTVEVDDAELERYLAGEKIDLGELRATFVKAMTLGRVVPILFTSARDEVGIDDLMHILIEEGPSPVSGRARRLRRVSASTSAGGDEAAPSELSADLVEIPCDPDKPFVAQVFKVTTDPHLGQVAMLRVLQGKLDGQTPFVCAADKRLRKAGHILKVEGRDHPEVDAVAYAGDIVALAKVEDIHVDQLLHDPQVAGDLEVVRSIYPTPMLSFAVEGKNRGDEVKLGTALQKIAEEDPTFKFAHDPVTHELVLSGLGEVHLRVLLERLKNRFGLEVTSRPPTVPYRETISTRAEGHCRHKKQTGGAGQFAEVFLRIEPLPRGGGFEFKSEVFGGAIPTHFIPAVEKGVRDGMADGFLAGFPLHDIRVVVYDGKAHAVDSKDIAFRAAGRKALKDAVEKARPVLLEPMVTMEITVPEQYLGAITGDLKHYRARVMGVDSAAGGLSLVRAQAPLSELGNYGGQLRGATAGQGSYALELSHYDAVPPNVQQKIIDARPKRAAAQDD